MLAITGPLDVVLLMAGALVVVTVVGSAARTVVLPDGRTPRMARLTFSVANWTGRVLSSVFPSEDRKHLILSGVPAFALLSMPVVWLTGALAGFTLVFKALGTGNWREAYETAGSSLFTLGFSNLETIPAVTAEFLAAAVSISILALLVVTYLPTMYSVYSRREAITTEFETYAGTPPEAAEMLVRYHRLAGLDRADRIWMDWNSWFTETRETHTALPMVVLFRSAKPGRSWVTTTAAVLDAAALRVAVVDVPFDASTALCIRSGFLCLRDVATPHRIEHDPDPAPDDPISITRDDFDATYDKMAAAGVPLHPREQAWTAFSGWRVNYDSVLNDLSDMLQLARPRLTKRVEAPA